VDVSALKTTHSRRAAGFPVRNCAQPFWMVLLQHSREAGSIPKESIDCSLLEGLLVLEIVLHCYFCTSRRAPVQWISVMHSCAQQGTKTAKVQLTATASQHQLVAVAQCRAISSAQLVDVTLPLIYSLFSRGASGYCELSAGLSHLLIRPRHEKHV
jgi:hypothetical protein